MPTPETVSDAELLDGRFAVLLYIPQTISLRSVHGAKNTQTTRQRVGVTVLMGLIFVAAIGAAYATTLSRTAWAPHVQVHGLSFVLPGDWQPVPGSPGTQGQHDQSSSFRIHKTRSGCP